MRKDGKSQYQLKKEKLIKIKWIIATDKLAWKNLQTTRTEEESKEWAKIIKMPNEIINEIWKIVKDEKDND